MFRTLRRITYAVLASGAIVMAVLAFIGFWTAMLPFIASLLKLDWKGIGVTLMLMAICLGGVFGAACLYIGIFTFPIAEARQRQRLSIGIVAGIAAMAMVQYLPLLTDGPEYGPSLFLGVLPVVIGLVLLLELWLPVQRERAASGNQELR